MNIIENINMVELFRRPRSKRRRIVNKWKKHGKNMRPMTSAFIINDGSTIVCHPCVAVQLRKCDREWGRFGK